MDGQEAMSAENCVEKGESGDRCAEKYEDGGQLVDDDEAAVQGGMGGGSIGHAEWRVGVKTDHTAGTLDYDGVDDDNS